MRVLAIDPGTTQSAYLVWTDGHIERCGIEPNDVMLRMMKFREITDMRDFDVIAIEMIASFGMPVGREVFETVLFIGRLYEHCRPEPRLVYRQAVKLHHCHSVRAKDANVNQALRDKYGDKGTKSNPGITYGLKSHLWSCFAIATFISETSASFKTEDRAMASAIPRVPSSGAENLTASLTS